MSAKVIQVIVTETLIGSGLIPKDPVRTLIQYWSFDGELLAERDTWKPSDNMALGA